MEMIPKLLVVGLAAPTLNIKGGAKVSSDQLHRIFSELAPDVGYRNYEETPDGLAARMYRDSEDDSLTIQPPILQVRDRIATTVEKSADQAQATLRTAARHLGVTEVWNLGVQLVYHSPAPAKDGRGFVLRRVFQRDDAELEPLKAGGGDLWVGVKVVMSFNEWHYMLSVEPLVQDMEYLYINLDAQAQGPADLNSIKDQVVEAVRYVDRSVSSYLDGLTAK